MRILLVLLLTLTTFGLKASAEGFPFTDVSEGSTYYSAVKSLYDSQIITDDGTHTFRPNDSLTRDMFIGLSVGVSCDYCQSPNIDDIVQFQISPFKDISKENPYYYCIAQAAEKNIVQGFPLDQNGQYTCEDGQSYTEAPFCQSNKITRIEAAIMLLRQADLWNEQLNKSYNKYASISDVTDEYFGYAQKGVEAGILTIKGGKILPDEYISRGEFAMMASTILAYNQCTPQDKNTTVGSAIEIQGVGGSRLNRSVFTKDAVFSLVSLTSESTTYTYTWKAIEGNSRKAVTNDGKTFSSGLLGSGIWYIEFSVGDPKNGEKVSSSTMTLLIGDGGGTGSGTSGAIGVGNGDGRDTKGNGGIGGVGGTGDVGINGVLYPSLSLIANPLTPGAGTAVVFNSYSLGNGPLTYSWDFGDGNQVKTTTTASGNAGSVSHTYITPGIYTAKVTMTDSSGKSALGSVVTEISGKIDTDSDGVEDAFDTCPGVKGSPQNNGCPVFQTNIYTQGGFLSANNTSGNASISVTNTSNSNSQVIAANTTGNIPGNTNAPLAATVNANASTDTDNDGISDALDACPTIPGNALTGGCPLIGSFLGNVEKNTCIMGQLEQFGGIIIEPVCTVCPCPTSISLGNGIRKCDIIFPAILSKDLSTIYSRGTLYQIQ